MVAVVNTVLRAIFYQPGTILCADLQRQRKLLAFWHARGGQKGTGNVIDIFYRAG
jgi:hypothetical protein